MPPPETIDEVKELLRAVENLKKAASDPSATDAFKASVSGLLPAVDAFKKKAVEGGIAVTGFMAAVSSVSLEKFASGIAGLGGMIKKFVGSIDLSKDGLGRLGVEMGLVYAVASGRIGMSDELKDLNSAVGGTTAQMTSMFDTITSLSPAFKEWANKTDGLGAMIKRTFAQVDAVKKMETGLLMNAAAAGNLNAAMKSIDGTMANLSDMTLSFSRLTSEAGTANNITAGQAANYAKELMKIPGALGMVIDRTADGQSQMSMLSATIKVATGTFQPFQDVMKDVEMLFKNWNVTGKDSLDFVTKMAAAAQSLKMPMDIMRSYVHEVGEQFKFLGDNTMSAIDIMTRFEPAFQDSGLGPAAIKDLVKGMTQGIAQMGVAERGFVSAKTGGPGGLQGGYQLAQQLADGDMAGVFGKVEDTIKGMFGGQVVTLKQASQDARAAAQFTKQVQMLTTGPLKIANTEAEAFKILDAFAAGTMPEVALGKMPEDPTEAAMNRGNEIQERQYSELVMINNQLKHFGTVAANMAFTRMRQGIGSGLGTGTPWDLARLARVRRQRGEAEGFAATRKVQEEEPSGEAPGGTRERELSGAVDTVKGVIGQIGGVAENLIRGIGEAPPQEGLFGEAAPRKPLFGGYMGMGEPTLEQAGTMGKLERQGFSTSEVMRTHGAGMLPGGRMRRDMAAAQRPEERSRGEGAEKERRGGENTIVVEVRSDEELKRVMRVIIDEDGNIREANKAFG